MDRLVDIAEVFLGRAPPRANPDETTVPLQIVALRDITARITPREQLDWIEAAPGAETIRQAVAGDIILTARGRLRAALVEPQHDGVAVGSNLILLRLRAGFPPALVLAYLRHPEVERRLLMETAGTATPGISIEGLRQLELRVPPAETWAEAAELVESVELYHNEIVEAARLLKQGVSEWVFDQMEAEEPR